MFKNDLILIDITITELMLSNDPNVENANFTELERYYGYFFNKDDDNITNLKHLYKYLESNITVKEDTNSELPSPYIQGD